ncbi:MAG TPA: alpha/beta hydrolase [Usitatibacter sp.]|nr:alpha/beta hydrolase [Usitatibacter sp.]
MPQLTPEFVEREYNNRALVPDHPEYFARWARDSEFVRSTLPCELDLAYGTDPRHRMDFFPAARARGTLVFIHGGYWRTLDKSIFSWLAAAWVAAGVNVALPNYRLAPQVGIGEIVDDVVMAMNWLMGSPSALGEGRGEGNVVISGHSAGGHLTAALFAAPRDRLHFDPARIVGGVPISGVFEFAPLKLFSFNADFRLDDEAVARLDLARRARSIEAPLVVAAGAAESSEFQRQSRLLAEAWSPQVKSLILLPGLNHFSVVDAFAERGQPLYEETLRLWDL